MTDYRRGDYVRLSIPWGDTGRYYYQYAVAADIPGNHCKHSKTCWVVVADDNDWDQVGTFVTPHYIDRHDPELLHRIEE